MEDNKISTLLSVNARCRHTFSEGMHVDPHASITFSMLLEYPRHQLSPISQCRKTEPKKKGRFISLDPEEK